MTNLSRYKIGVTCTASAATALIYVESGYLYAWAYTPGTASAYATGATATIDFITDIRTGAVGVATHDGMQYVNTSVAVRRYPRNKEQTTAGATVADMTNGLMIPLSREHIRVTIASGGASGNGWWEFYVEGNGSPVTAS